jgi:hypothetical protein
MATLNKLVRNAPNLKLNVFLLKYTAMSAILVRKNALSPLDRVGYLLDGLSVELRRKVLEFCAKKSWRLSTHDSGTSDPNYDELKEFVLQKAVAAQKEVAYSGERSTRQESSIPTASVAVEIKANVPTPTPTPDLTPEMTPKTTPATSNDIAELTKQFSQLALAIQAGLRPTGTPSAMPTAPVQPAFQPAFQPGRPPFDPNRPRRCMWCDSTEHGKWQCQELKEALARGDVKTNETGKIAFASTGIEAPLMTGRGGMKILFPTAPKPTPQTVNTSAITLGSTASLGSGNTVHVVTMRPDGTELHEIITADVNEKRRRNEFGKGTKLPETNPHTTDTELPHIRPTQQSSPPTQPAQPVQPTQPAQPTGQTDVPMTDAQPKEKKYRLGSELRETVPITEIAEKIMNTSINLSLKEVFAASPDLAAHFSDQARKRRRPIDPPETNINNTGTSNVNAAFTPQVTSISSKPLYACPSGRAKATLEDTITTHALLDDGSEVNLMPRRVFDQLDIPIDTNID